MPVKDDERKLLLRCVNSTGTYLLRREGEHWERTFVSLEEALSFATEQVQEVTTLLVYEESGKLLIETTVG